MQNENSNQRRVSPGSRSTVEYRGTPDSLDPWIAWILLEGTLYRSTVPTMAGSQGNVT